MNDRTELFLTEKEMDDLIDELTKELAMLRTKADMSQEDVATLIGVSRQTYGAIERQSRRMTWNTYLSLIMFFDYNKKTHEILRSLSAFPTKFVNNINGTDTANEVNLAEFLGAKGYSIMETLDDQALSTIKTTVMLEYARCSQISSDAIIRAFDGITFKRPDSRQYSEETVSKAIRSLRESRKKTARRG